MPVYVSISLFFLLSLLNTTPRCFELIDLLQCIAAHLQRTLPWGFLESPGFLEKCYFLMCTTITFAINFADD